MDNLNYGIIGNCESAALVSDKGVIEWCCLPIFDSPSVFAKILDNSKGGEFGFNVSDDYKIMQGYLKNTNILVTKFQNSDNIFELYDFMPRYISELGDCYTPPEVIRIIKYISGNPEISVNYNPKLKYGISDCKNQITQSFLKTIIENEEYQSVYLYSNIDYNDILEQKNIIINSDIYFLLSYNQKILEPNIEKVFLEFERTKVYWLNWVDRTITFKKYSNEIIRSALTLKLLTYQKTGAILAAPTTSLPESIGEKRNWDYRFCWIRDASMIISTLTKIGHYKSAENYINFIISVIPFKEDKIQIMYGINGEKILEEKILNHLNGYYNSKPVRIGNQAYKQRQNDIYGVLIDVIYTHIISQEKNSQKKEHLWAIVRRLLYYVKRDWNKPDKGIWEIRSDKKHFTFSKVLCWVAFDRGSKIARHFGKEDIAIEWDNIKAIIKYNILKKSWNKTIGAFTQFYGSNDLDASNLLMQEYGFINADDPMYVATVKKTYESLSNDGLMYRYKNRDDFGKPSSSFIICSFWMIKSLFKIGERNLAKSLFENILNHSNHLGLYSEDMDFKTKRLLGNFPQGYSHLALIDTALLLSGES